MLRAALALGAALAAKTKPAPPPPSQKKLAEENLAVASAKLKRALLKRTARSDVIHERSVAALDLERSVEEAKGLGGGCGAQDDPCKTMPEVVTHEMRVHVAELNPGYLNDLRKAVSAKCNHTYPVMDYKPVCDAFRADPTVHQLGMRCAAKRERFAKDLAAFLKCARGEAKARDVLDASAELLEGTATHYTVGVVLRMSNEQHAHEAAQVRRQAERAEEAEREEELAAEYAPPDPPVMKVYLDAAALGEHEDASALGKPGHSRRTQSRSTAVGSGSDTDSEWESEPSPETYRLIKRLSKSGLAGPAPHGGAAPETIRAAYADAMEQRKAALFPWSL